MFEKFVQGDAAVSQIYHRDGRVRAELVVDRQPPEVLHPGESALHDPPPPRRHEVPARQLGPRGDLAPSLTITQSARLPPRPPSAMILLRRRDAPRSPSRTSMAPLPSWTLAGCTAAPMTSPRLSVTTCRLRPSTFLFPSMPRFASTRCDILTLRESMTPRLGSGRLPSLHRVSPTSSADSCSSPPRPFAEVVADGLPGAEVGGERPPLRTRAKHAEEGPERLPDAPFPLPSFAVYYFSHNFECRVRLVGQAVFHSFNCLSILKLRKSSRLII